MDEIKMMYILYVTSQIISISKFQISIFKNLILIIRYRCWNVMAFGKLFNTNYFYKCMHISHSNKDFVEKVLN